MNLSTHYLGLSLRSPLIVGASPFGDTVEAAKRVEGAGAAALVLRSLFAEQIDAARCPANDRENGQSKYVLSLDEYLRQVERLKKALAIPVIASLNGHAPGSWTDFAGQLARAGADAIELNFYQVVSDPGLPADRVELDMLETMGLVSRAVTVPVAAKLSPYHASVAQVAVALELAGAAGIVLFNRFYQPDVDTDLIEAQPVLQLSDPGELRLRLRWLAILSPLLRGSLAATGGIHTSAGAVKALLTGAHVVQVVSAVLKHGPRILVDMEKGLAAWMEAHGFSDVSQFRGRLDHLRSGNPAAFERANYIQALQSWKA